MTPKPCFGYVLKTTTKTKNQRKKMHGIMERDSIVSIKACWHGLERLMKAIGFSEMTDTGNPLGFYVEKQPIEQWVNGELIDVFDSSVKLVDNDGRIVSVVGSDYGIVQPKRFAELVVNSMDGIPHNIETAMTLFNRRKQVICVSLSDEGFEVKPNDKFLSHLVFTSSLDGSESLSVWDTMTRVVCNNTLRASYRDRSKGAINLTTKHTKNVCDRIENMERAIQTMAEERKQAASVLAECVNYALSVSDAEKLIAGFNDSVSTRAMNVKDEIVTLFQKGKGNEGKSLYDLVNGVTEYFTHYSVGEKVEDREGKLLVSSEFGTGAKRKAGFFNAIRDDDGLDNEAIDKLAANGEKLLLEYAKG